MTTLLQRLPLLGPLLGRLSARPAPLGPREAEVEAVLQELRPAFRADGGDLTVASVGEGGLVRLQPHGSCSGCGASFLTLQGAVRPRLMERLPWVTGVELAGS
ncbi:MAG: NifU family protein, partial [Planctomycetota bacterium]|nr:NifU family protein [Planctomycetota bacterium]